jgi:2,3-bisphosphoglycerate-dependent phosphoglycerate mutase
VERAVPGRQWRVDLLPRLFLIRHGESVWNRQRRFSGWGDPPLSAEGRRQALAAGRLLAGAGALPGAVFCSLLARARQTLTLALDASGASPSLTVFSWRLNERHCGRWEGLPKSEVKDGRLAQWRDDPSARPPLMEPDDARHPRHDPRYRDLEPEVLPAGESHFDLLDRLRPFWRERIMPALSRQACVWVVAHSGSLWGLACLLHERCGQRLPPWTIPLAEPVCLELDQDLMPLATGFLDSKNKALPPRLLVPEPSAN